MTFVAFGKKKNSSILVFVSPPLWHHCVVRIKPLETKQLFLLSVHSNLSKKIVREKTDALLFLLFNGLKKNQKNMLKQSFSVFRSNLR